MNNLSILNKIVELISQKNPFQRKSLKKHIESCSKNFLEKSEWYLRNYVSFLRTKNIDLEYIVNSYLMMVEDILIEQTNFLRIGKYRYDNLKDVYEKVYSNKEYMFKYMIGVALSQFLWRNHRDMFLFFIKKIRDIKGENYLEIGPGHGLFFMEAISGNNFTNFHAIDISETSLELTKDFIDYSMDMKNKNVSFYLSDINTFNFGEKYDFITMGEVLEHVEDPYPLLKSIHNLLKENGQAFISTCANAPVIDHIYLYNSIDEIREDITKAGLKVIDEIVICNDETKEKDWIFKKANLSFTCIAKKNN